jgi:hypothetical protein
MKTFKVSERENEKEEKWSLALAVKTAEERQVKEKERRKVNEIKKTHAKAEIHEKVCREMSMTRTRFSPAVYSRRFIL